MMNPYGYKEEIVLSRDRKKDYMSRVSKFGKRSWGAIGKEKNVLHLTDFLHYLRHHL